VPADKARARRHETPAEGFAARNRSGGRIPPPKVCHVLRDKLKTVPKGLPQGVFTRERTRDGRLGDGASNRTLAPDQHFDHRISRGSSRIPVRHLSPAILLENQLVPRQAPFIDGLHRMSKERFFAHLKAKFSPRLRAAGFNGSGQNFRRVRGEVIHAISIQGNKYGESCALNLGIHIAFLPITWDGQLPDLGTIEETSCEFRKRLAKGADTECWWKYSDVLTSPEESAASLIETFFAEGEPYFERFSSVQTILSALEFDVLEKNLPPAIGRSTPVKYALTAARIHAHLGHGEACRRAAALGLTRIGKAEALRTELEALSLIPG
jgi:Domain of unknown function (DUF4304)